MNITIDIGAIAMGIAGATTIANYFCMREARRLESNMINLCGSIVKAFSTLENKVEGDHERANKLAANS